VEKLDALDATRIAFYDKHKRYPEGPEDTLNAWASELGVKKDAIELVCDAHRSYAGKAIHRVCAACLAMSSVGGKDKGGTRRGTRSHPPGKK
jgi:hypothetical protein